MIFQRPFGLVIIAYALLFAGCASTVPPQPITEEPLTSGLTTATEAAQAVEQDQRQALIYGSNIQGESPFSDLGDDTPEPADDTPEPSDDTPEPSDDTPEPADDTPEPADDAPEPADEEPETQD